MSSTSRTVRANILYAPFRRAGVGIYKSRTGEFWVTEMFLSNSGGSGKA